MSERRLGANTEQAFRRDYELSAEAAPPSQRQRERRSDCAGAGPGAGAAEALPVSTGVGDKTGRVVFRGQQTQVAGAAGQDEGSFQLGVLWI